MKKEWIVPDLESSDKSGILAEMVERLVDGGRVSDAGEAVNVLMERESLGSTGIGEGIAIPHGKLKELDEVVAVFGRSVEGVDFGSMDGEPVHLLFLLMAPENSASVHLKALARISRLLKARSFREELLMAEGQEEIFEKITLEDEKNP